MDLEKSRTKTCWQPALLLSMALAACLMVRPAFSQTPTIEELEKRIYEAKKVKEAKEQAEAESKRQQEQQREQQSTEAAAKQGTVIIENDAPCSLSIDMERIGKVLPVGASEMTVQRGERLIECTSTDDPEISVSRVVRVKAVEKTRVQLRLKEKLAAEQRQEASKMANANAPQQRSAARPGSQPAGTRRFDDVAKGLLSDRRTGVIWSAADNGADVNWDDATQYCTHRGMQLPTVAQLQSLVDRSGTMTTPCETKQCKISGRFHLSGYQFWSRQHEGERWAVFVSLNNGRRSFDYAGTRDNFRALCVRGA
jgi:uncharacterized protein DUF1566